MNTCSSLLYRLVILCNNCSFNKTFASRISNNFYGNYLFLSSMPITDVMYSRYKSILTCWKKEKLHRLFFPYAKDEVIALDNIIRLRPKEELKRSTQLIAIMCIESVTFLLFKCWCSCFWSNTKCHILTFAMILIDNVFRAR